MENCLTKEDARLCFWFGFSLPILGLVVAAIIGKGEGVRHALHGLRWCVAAVVFVLVVWTGVSREMRDRAMWEEAP